MSRTVEVARRWWTGPDLRGQERPITVDQSNRSVIIDELVVVKWLEPPVPEPHPGVRLLTHLQAVGFDEMPRFLGAEVVDGKVEAVVTGFVPGALDGWDWFVEEVTAWLRGETPPDVPFASARAVGMLGARLHVALATPTPVIPQPIATGSTVPMLGQAMRLLDRCLAVTDAESPAGRALHDREDLVRAALAPLGSIGSVTLQPVHGDLHVGQVLRAGSRLLVTDFDGNPLTDTSERHLPQPAARDVAALVQSVDHVGRVAAKREPAHADEAAYFAQKGAAATLAAYRTTLHDLGRAELYDERLLAPLRVAQELHELEYAAVYLPRWAYVPHAALVAMFPEPLERGS